MSNKSKGGAKWKLKINKSQMAENFHKKKEMEGEGEREREREREREGEGEGEGEGGRE